jgi:DnaJ family protein C protein 19
MGNLGANASATGDDPFQYHKGGFDTHMTAEEAALILNLKNGKNSTKVEIERAHRNLMMKNHPDLGGSDYVATKVNEAKTVLLPQEQQK